MRKVIIISVFTILIVPTIILSQSDSTNPLNINNLNGFCCGAISGDNLFVGGWGVIHCYNVSDPSAPSYIGTSELLSHIDHLHKGDGIAVDGNYAYIGLYGYEGGIKVVDISDPSSMAVIGSFGGSSLPVGGIAIDDSVLFVTDRDESRRLLSLDISDPSNPVLLDEISTGGYGRGVDINGDYVFVAASELDLKIFDKSDPNNLVEVGSLDIGGYTDWAREIYAGDVLAYLVRAGGGIAVIDVSDPANPSFLDEYNSGAIFQDVFQMGSYIYSVSIDSLFVFSPTLELVESTAVEGGGCRVGIPKNNNIFVTSWGGSSKSLHSYEVQLVTGCEEITADSNFRSINYPNPFNPVTTIKYYATKANTPLDLEIFNVAGQRIFRKRLSPAHSGANKATWDGRNSSGKRIASGVYFYRISAENSRGDVQKGKMILAR